MIAFGIVSACAVVAWLFSGKLFEPRAVGTGTCKDCQKLAPLFRFAGSQLCKRCFDRIDGMIP